MFTSQKTWLGGSPGSETLTSSDLDAGMCEGGTERSGEQSAPETAPMGKIPLPETGQGKRMCSKGERRASGPGVHCFCQLLQPLSGPAGARKTGEVMFDFFNPPKLH